MIDYRNRKARPLTIQKALPVVASIGIILVVALLRERSRTLAAILATMPINMVLGMWIVSGAAEADAQVMTDFVRSLLVGLVPSFIWLLMVYGALRAGAPLWTAILAGYGVWGALIALAFWMGVLTPGR
jgi:hypothetical protein